MGNWAQEVQGQRRELKLPLSPLLPAPLPLLPLPPQLPHFPHSLLPKSTSLPE